MGYNPFGLSDKTNFWDDYKARIKNMNESLFGVDHNKTFHGKLVNTLSPDEWIAYQDEAQTKYGVKIDKAPPKKKE